MNSNSNPGLDGYNNNNMKATAEGKAKGKGKGKEEGRTDLEDDVQECHLQQEPAINHDDNNNNNDDGDIDDDNRYLLANIAGTISNQYPLALLDVQLESDIPPNSNPTALSRNEPENTDIDILLGFRSNRDTRTSNNNPGNFTTIPNINGYSHHSHQNNHRHHPDYDYHYNYDYERDYRLEESAAESSSTRSVHVVNANANENGHLGINVAGYSTTTTTATSNIQLQVHSGNNHPPSPPTATTTTTTAIDIDIDIDITIGVDIPRTITPPPFPFPPPLPQPHPNHHHLPIKINWTGRIVVPTLLEEQHCERAALDAALHHQDEYTFVSLLIRGGVHNFTRDYRSRKTMCQAHLTVNYKTATQVRTKKHFPAHVYLLPAPLGEKLGDDQQGDQGGGYVVDWVEWFREKRDRY